VTLKLVKKGQMDQTLASKAYDQASESFTYTDEELEQYYADLNGSRDLFDYLVYDVKAATAEGADAPDDTAKAEAAATADAISMAYQDGGDIEDITERFEAAVDSQTGETGEEKPTLRSGISGSGLTAEYSEWLMGERKAGDVTVIADADGSGSSVLVFLSRNDNHYKTASVRHILIRAEADADGNYTDEAKAAAKTRAEELLAEWEAGDKNELAFASLAFLYSEDGGSRGNGGLYTDVRQGQMVEEFDRFCFEEHEYGDTAIVYGESGSYAGYHVMFYVGSDIARNASARDALCNEALEGWFAEITEGLEPVYRWAYKLVD
jgi:parvulin-like peptidyl-prolyl isomerase